MVCGGCSKAVTRILTKQFGKSLPVHKRRWVGDCRSRPNAYAGVTEEQINIDMDAQKVTVTTDDEKPAEQMLEALQKWGTAANKKVELA